MIGPGSRLWYEFAGVETTFNLRLRNEEIKEFKYGGYISSDSLGSHIKVYEKDNTIVSIYDSILERWYGEKVE